MNETIIFFMVSVFVICIVSALDKTNYDKEYRKFKKISDEISKK